MAKTVLIPITNYNEEIEVIAPVDILRRSGVKVTIASIADTISVKTSRNVILTADCFLSDCLQQDYDLIVLPGGMPGAEYLRDCESLIALLKKQKAQNRLFAALCAVPAITLHPHGLVDNLKITCYPALKDQITKAIYVDEKVVVDKNCITSQGPGTALEFALILVQILLNEKIANKIRAAMLI